MTLKFNFTFEILYFKLYEIKVTAKMHPQPFASYHTVKEAIQVAFAIVLNTDQGAFKMITVAVFTDILF